MLPTTESKAVVRFQANETHNEFGSAVYGSRSARPASSLAIHLTIHTLERVVRGLLPFYGVNCPIAIYDNTESESLVARGTLGAIDGWEPPHQSLLLVIG